MAALLMLLKCCKRQHCWCVELLLSVALLMLLRCGSSGIVTSAGDNLLIGISNTQFPNIPVYSAKYSCIMQR